MNLHPEILALIKSSEVLEPETLRSVYPDISEAEFNQIMALKTLWSTRGFWENMFCFGTMVHALNMRVPDPRLIQGCTATELWYALDIAHRLYPDREYAKEVLLYIRYCMNLEAVYIYPPYLDLPNPYYPEAVNLAERGPFPLDESVEGIQAAKYLAIRAALESKKGLI